MNKTSLSESDICDKLIRAALQQAGWRGREQIFREYPSRAGRVVHGNVAQRDKSTVVRAAYALFYKANLPLAVVAAKGNHTVPTGASAGAIFFPDFFFSLKAITRVQL